MTTLQSARKFKELLGADVEPVPYNYAMLFNAETFGERRRAQRRFKLLQAIDANLRPMLLANEKVYFLTPGTTVSMSEQFIVGWLAYYLNMHALVFTSNRVLLLQIDRSRRPSGLVSQMPYSVIASVRSTWNGLCRVKLINRKVYDFQHVPSADRKFLSKFLVGVVQGSTAPFNYSHGIEHLCPHCYTAVPGHPPACPACGATFKSSTKAGLLSFLLPGIGDWYLGHRGFALLEMLGTAALWTGLGLLPGFAPAVAHYGLLAKYYWPAAGIVVVLAHLCDALMTRHFGRKGHYLAARPTGPANRPIPVSLAMPKPKVLEAQKPLTLRRDPPNRIGG